MATYKALPPAEAVGTVDVSGAFQRPSSVSPHSCPLGPPERTMTDDGRGRRAFLRLLGAAALGTAAGCAVPTGSQSAGGDGPAGSRPTATPRAPNPYARVYRETVDSVVLVLTPGPEGPQGSGFVLDDAGRVLTNQHVVGDADAVDVRFADGTWAAAEVLGTDAYTDLAVLDPAERPAAARPLPLVEDSPAIGTEVVAIGSPFGLEESLTTGVVSGVDRSISTRGGFTIPDAVQTDAAVNPGNSGGPLVTLDGEVVGVIRSGGGDNIGFAVSAALVRRVAPVLARRGRYRHAWVGVGILDVTPTVAEANGLDRVAGVYVARVVEGGPADGVLRGSDGEATVDGATVPVGGDVIVSMGGEPVPTSGALGRYLALETRPGETVAVGVLRDGAETTVDLTLGARPSA